MPDEQREPTQARVEKLLACVLDGPDDLDLDLEQWHDELVALAEDVRTALEPAPPSEQREAIARVALAERLESEVIGYSIALGLTEAQLDLLREAASTIDQQTKVIEAADELARVITAYPLAPRPDMGWPAVSAARDAYRSTRTTEGEDG